MGHQPAAALRQGLRMGDHPPHPPEAGPRPGEETVSHRERHLGTDREGRLGEQVEGMGHHALGRVLDRHDPELHPSALDVTEDLGHRARPAVLGRRSEQLARRQVGVGGLRPQVRDP